MSYCYQVMVTSIYCWKKSSGIILLYTEVYGVPSLTANSLIESANAYHPIEESPLL